MKTLLHAPLLQVLHFISLVLESCLFLSLFLLLPLQIQLLVGADVGVEDIRFCLLEIVL